MNRFGVLIMTALMTSLLMGCTLNSNPKGMPLPNLDFSYIEPYRVFNGAVEIKQDFSPNAKTNEALRSFVTAPHVIINDYAQNRFVTAKENLPVRMVLNIEKADVLKTTMNQGMIGFLTGDNQDAYHLDILITLAEIDLNGRIKEPYHISISRKISLSENLTLAERDFHQFEFLEKMMRDLDKAVNKILFKKMKN